MQSPRLSPRSARMPRPSPQQTHASGNNGGAYYANPHAGAGANGDAYGYYPPSAYPSAPGPTDTYAYTQRSQQEDAAGTMNGPASVSYANGSGSEGGGGGGGTHVDDGFHGRDGANTWNGADGGDETSPSDQYRNPFTYTPTKKGARGRSGRSSEEEDGMDEHERRESVAKQAEEIKRSAARVTALEEELARSKSREAELETELATSKTRADELKKELEEERGKTVEAMAETADVMTERDDAITSCAQAVKERDDVLVYAKSVNDWAEDFNRNADNNDASVDTSGMNLRSMLATFEERGLELKEARAAVAILDSKLVISQQQLVHIRGKYKAAKAKVAELCRVHATETKEANDKLTAVLRHQHQQRQEQGVPYSAGLEARAGRPHSTANRPLSPQPRTTLEALRNR